MTVARLRINMLLYRIIVWPVFLLSAVGGMATQFPEFIENKGQWNDLTTFRADLPGGVFWADRDGFTFTVLGDGWGSLAHGVPLEPVDEAAYGIHHYKVHFQGALAPIVTGEKPHEHHYNYYLGDNPSRWANGAKPYRKIRYHGVYTDIDALVYGKNGRLKYDFYVHPHADPGQIKLRYEGADSIRVVNENLVVYTSVREVVELAPYAYQRIGNTIETVDCRFALENGLVHFEVGDYNPNFDLIIDPEIAFSTFIGSTGSNFGFTACDDPDGNLIAGACVFGAGYPTTLGAVQSTFSTVLNGNCDVAISKFSSDTGTLMYSTYLGGSGLEMPHSVIADSEGNYIVMGTTGSTNFPSTAGVFQPVLNGGPLFSFANFFIQASHVQGCDFFITKFNGDDSGLMASTFIGGSGTDGMNMGDKLFYNYGDPFRGEVIVDGENNIIVASTTNSNDFPMAGNAPQNTYAGNQDGIVFKLSPDLTTLLWSTYIGGNAPDAAYSVQLDSNGGIVVTGGTKSANLPMGGTNYQSAFAGDVDAFVYRYSPDGQTLEASTYFGTPDYDQAYFVQLDLDDNIYLFGQSNGGLELIGDVYGIPNSGQFVVKLDYGLQNLVWQTTVGTGSGQIDISPTAFLVSDCDQIYLTGWGGFTNAFQAPYATQSTTQGFPVTDDAFQSTTDGSDFYLCVLDPDASQLAYATYFGGNVSNEHVDGGTSKFDKDGSVYHAVCAGCGGNSDFPTTPGAWSATNNSSNCNLGVFKFDLAIIEAGIAVAGPFEVCQFEPAEFINESTGADTYFWDFGDGATSNDENPTHAYSAPGTYQVTLSASHSLECSTPDQAVVTIEVLPSPVPEIDDVPTLCPGESVQLNAVGTPNLYWLEDPTLSATDIPNPIATPTESGTTYFVIDSNNCGTDTTAVTVMWHTIELTFPADALICIGESIALSASGGANYQWSPSGTLSAAVGPTVVATPTVTTTYTLTITTAEGCSLSETVTVTVDLNPPGGETYPTVFACTGENTGLGASDGFGWAWEPANLVSDPFSQFPFVNLTEDTWFTVEVFNSCGSGTDSVLVSVITPQAFAGNDGAVCRGSAYPVWAAGGETYFWTPNSSVANPTAAETSVFPTETTAYTVFVTDEFGCTASTSVNVNVLPLPYVYAGPDRVIEWLESNYLFGTADGVEWWWEPETYLDCSSCITPIVTPEESMWYTLYTIDANGCRNADSVYIDVFSPIYVPNTFTPNNDGTNDVFKAEGVNVRGFRMEIRNRWGELIFESDDISKGWDGSVRDGDFYAQIDTYIWVVYHDTKDGREKLTGHVNVIR